MTPQQALEQYRRLMAAAEFEYFYETTIFGDPQMLRETAQTMLKYALDPPQACK